ncbi:RNA polymerase Rpb3/Rpb11 dimerization domain protein, partial [Chlamydia psittaci 08-2626_L3]
YRRCNKYHLEFERSFIKEISFPRQ